MKTEQIIILVVAFFLGMLLLNMVKNVCGCEVKEGFAVTDEYLEMLNNNYLNNDVMEDCFRDLSGRRNHPYCPSIENYTDLCTKSAESPCNDDETISAVLNDGGCSITPQEFLEHIQGGSGHPRASWCPGVDGDGGSPPPPPPPGGAPACRTHTCPGRTYRSGTLDQSCTGVGNCTNCCTECEYAAAVPASEWCRSADALTGDVCSTEQANLKQGLTATGSSADRIECPINEVQMDCANYCANKDYRWRTDMSVCPSAADVACTDTYPGGDMGQAEYQCKGADGHVWTGDRSLSGENCRDPKPTRLDCPEVAAGTKCPDAALPFCSDQGCVAEEAVVCDPTSQENSGCLNEGTCVSVGGDAPSRCECPANYLGSNCETLFSQGGGWVPYLAEWGAGAPGWVGDLLIAPGGDYTDFVAALDPATKIGYIPEGDTQCIAFTDAALAENMRALRNDAGNVSVERWCEIPNEC